MMIHLRQNGVIIGSLDYCRMIKQGDIIPLDIITASGTGTSKMRLEAVNDPVKAPIYGWVVDVKFLSISEWG